MNCVYVLQQRSASGIRLPSSRTQDEKKDRKSKSVSPSLSVKKSVPEVSWQHMKMTLIFWMYYRLWVSISKKSLFMQDSHSLSRTPSPFKKEKEDKASKNKRYTTFFLTLLLFYWLSEAVSYDFKFPLDQNLRSQKKRALQKKAHYRLQKQPMEGQNQDLNHHRIPNPQDSQGHIHILVQFHKNLHGRDLHQTLGQQGRNLNRLLSKLTPVVIRRVKGMFKMFEW